MTSPNLKAVIFDYGRTLYDRDNQEFFPETREVLEYLFPKYKLAIVSIAGEKDPPESRMKALKIAGFDRYFSSILFHTSAKDDLFWETFKRLQIPPPNCAIVDDRVIRGIAWGNKNGAITIWLRKGKFSTELPDEETGTPTHTITSLIRLKQLL